MTNNHSMLVFHFLFDVFFNSFFHFFHTFSFQTLKTKKGKRGWKGREEGIKR